MQHVQHHGAEGGTPCGSQREPRTPHSFKKCQRSKRRKTLCQMVLGHGITCAEVFQQRSQVLGEAFSRASPTSARHGPNVATQKFDFLGWPFFSGDTGYSQYMSLPEIVEVENLRNGRPVCIEKWSSFRGHGPLR